MSVTLVTIAMSLTFITHQFCRLELFALLVETCPVLRQPLLHQEPVLLREALVAPDLDKGINFIGISNILEREIHWQIFPSFENTSQSY